MLKIKVKHVVLLLLYAIPNTFLNFSIVYIINKVLAGNEAFMKDYMIIVFLSNIIYAYLLNIIFQKGLNKYTYKILYENEKALFGQILEADLITLEKYGTQRFYTAIEDLRIFSNLPYTLTHTVNSILMLLIGLVYMFTLSTVAATLVLILISLVAVCYFLVMHSMAIQVAALRKLNEKYYLYVKDLLYGFRELKMSAIRRHKLMTNHLTQNRDQSEMLNFKVNYVFLSINIISQYGLYFVIAIILFVLPAMNVLARADVIAYVVVILFISGPINNLVNLQQTYTRFIVANKRINHFMNDFRINEFSKSKKSAKINEFQSLVFNNISFQYDKEIGEKSFELGPIDMKIERGEVMFIVGGNGSGKSTFINVLTGLYKATSGKIILNHDVNADIETDLKNLMACIFTDNHIFSHNYDDYILEGNKDYSQLLKTMKLDHRITGDGEDLIRRKFSKGQSKRISMILALLEKKPILVLDEWAADQDPYFRKYFYEELIPKLQREGKTVIAVTHDDTYFHLANRIIKFEHGQIVKEINGRDRATLTEDIWQ